MKVKATYLNEKTEKILQREWETNTELKNKKETEVDGVTELAYILLQMMNEYDRHHKIREHAITKIIGPKPTNPLDFISNGERNKAVIEAVFGEDVFR